MDLDPFIFPSLLAGSVVEDLNGLRNISDCTLLGRAWSRSGMSKGVVDESLIGRREPVSWSFSGDKSTSGPGALAVASKGAAFGKFEGLSSEGWLMIVSRAAVEVGTADCIRLGELGLMDELAMVDGPGLTD